MNYGLSPNNRPTGGSWLHLERSILVSRILNCYVNYNETVIVMEIIIPNSHKKVHMNIVKEQGE